MKPEIVKTICDLCGSDDDPTWWYVEEDGGYAFIDIRAMFSNLESEAVADGRE